MIPKSNDATTLSRSHLQGDVVFLLGIPDEEIPLDLIHVPLKPPKMFVCW